MSSEIKGGGQTRARLGRVGKRVETGVAGCNLRSAQLIQKHAVSLVPVRTGRLQRALASPSAIGQGRDGVAFFGLRTKRLKTAAYYGHFVEWGTRASPGRAATGTRKAYRAHHATAAKPYLRPAIALAQPAIRDAYHETVQQIIAEAPK